VALGVGGAVVDHGEAFFEEAFERVDGAPMGPAERALDFLDGDMAAGLGDLEDEVVVTVERAARGAPPGR
jgi:hypothetical protein